MFDSQRVQEFFEMILGQSKGTAFIMSLERANGESTRPFTRPFNWPEDIHDMVRMAKERNDVGMDVYVSVGLFKEGVRNAERINVQSCQCIWLDADTTPPDTLEIPPSVILETSPDSFQAFWALEEPIDANTAENITQKLYHRYRKYGADKCWNANRYMRIPTTHNFKPSRVLPDGSFWEVKVVDLDSTPVAVSVFDSILSEPLPSVDWTYREPVDWRGDTPRYDGDCPPLPEIPGGFLYPPDIINEWEERNVGNRSDWTYNMVRHLLECGLDDATIKQALFAHPIIRDRMADPDKSIKSVVYDVEVRCFQRVREKGYHKRLLRRRKLLVEEKVVESEHDRKRIYTVRELADLPDLPWLIPNHIPAQGHVNFFGPSGVGKSLVALDWGMRLSLGLEWNGLQIAQVPVFYVVAEGLLVTKQRVKAWANRRGRDLDGLDNIFFYGEPVYLMDEGSVTRMQIHLDRIRCKPGLIIFDTLSQCLSGVNENSPEVMSKINAVMIELRELYGCTTLVVHHTGYEGDHERGHSSFPAAADTRIKVESVMGQITVDCEKQRGGEPFDTVFYDKLVVDPSVVAEQTTVRATSLTETTLEPYHKKIMAALYGQGTLSAQEVQAMSGMNVNRFTRYKAELQKSKLIRPADTWGKQIVLTPDGENMYNAVVLKRVMPKIDHAVLPNIGRDAKMF
jgi:hypothetical protein